MKIASLHASIILAALSIPSCADYSSQAVNARRGQSSALTSDAQLRQNRVQRTNEREDAEHGRAMGGLQRRQVLDPIYDVREGLNLLRSF